MTQQHTTAPKNHYTITGEQIDQAKYDQLRAHDYAGTREELINPDGWPATHWIFTNRNGVTSLVPVTIAN